MPTDQRDQAVLRERLTGSTLHEIGGRHGLTAEGVRGVVQRTSRQVLDDLESRLRELGTDEVELLAIPNQGGREFDFAIQYLGFAVRGLRERGVEVRVTWRDLASGIVLGIERTDG